MIEISQQYLMRYGIANMESINMKTIWQSNWKEAFGDESWVIALHEELNQFIRDDVWYLVPRLERVNVIKTKWFLKISVMKMGQL